ncbi:hypothetical protein [Nocardia farcinica]|uniref:Uncharacterized protein n=1 Tax=Nocardia farcinica (strain IFM 10152) TaxID=247156 RepID=Q5YMJ1_NOCFA|nr:hypothetical protein [Nocardia farcinica]BAD60600.1 hypothetical protein PNF1_750 [Nocardia farcinica IFM 10152]
MSSAAPGNVSRPCSAGWGVGAGLFVSTVVFVPAVFVVRQWLDLPEIPATPSHLRAHPVEVPDSYWITWLVAAVVLLAPGVALMLWPRMRRVAMGYTLTAGFVAGLLAALTIGFELGGFAPT